MAEEETRAGCRSPRAAARAGSAALANTKKRASVLCFVLRFGRAMKTDCDNFGGPAATATRALPKKKARN